MFTGKKILIASKYAGYMTGIEFYLCHLADCLRKSGAEVWGCFRHLGDRHAEFATHFDHFAVGETYEKQWFDLATLHKVDDMDDLEDFLQKYGSRACLFVHNHDDYCPRRVKYFPCSRKNCRLKYARIRCALCSMLKPPGFWKRGIWGELLEKFIRFPHRMNLFRRFPKVVVLSAFMRDTLMLNGCQPENLYVVPPAYEVCEHDAELAPKPILVFANNLLRRKGADIFLQVLKRLKHDFTARIVGDGVERCSLEEQAQKMGLKDKVVFCGNILNPGDYLKDADALISPSRFQSPFERTVADAFAWGVPAIAFDIGGTSEMIEDGENGYLIPFGDINAMASKVDMLLEDRYRAKQMGELGKRKLSRDFSLANFQRCFARLFS